EPPHLSSQFRFRTIAQGAAGNWRPPGVAAEPEPVAWAVPAQPGSDPVAVQSLAQSRHLVFGKRVEGIEDECSDCSGPTSLFVSPLGDPRVMNPVGGASRRRHQPPVVSRHRSDCGPADGFPNKRGKNGKVDGLSFPRPGTG